MKKTIINTSLLAILAVASSNAFADDLLDRINNHGTVVIATEGTYRPFNYHDETGKLTGYDIEVTRAVAKKLGFKVEFKEVPWDSMFTGLKAGRFDMMGKAALTTPQRRATFDKTDSYGYVGPMILNRKGEKKINDISEVKGLTAAQTLNSHYNELAVENGAKVIPVDGFAQSLMLVEQKRADFTINSSLVMQYYLRTHPNSGLQVGWRDTSHLIGGGFGLNKGHPEVIKKLNQALSELRKDGTLKRLSIKYFGEDASHP